MDHDVLSLPDNRRIAYRRTEGAGPAVVFLGGFRSDMTGTKAAFLEKWAKEAGRAFLRFDYTGHGASSGAFLEGSIGAWAADAEAVIAHLTQGPVVLVGSSMGGWISLILARKMGGIAGLIGIAAAPDFTEDLMWARFSEGQRKDLLEQGFVAEPSPYSDEPDMITRQLIEDGREQLVLRAPLRLPMPVRLLHGTADEEVPVGTALRLMDHAEAEDMHLTLVKGADHRFSTPDCLTMIAEAVSAVSAE